MDYDLLMSKCTNDTNTGKPVPLFYGHNPSKQESSPCDSKTRTPCPKNKLELMFFGALILIQQQFSFIRDYGNLEKSKRFLSITKKSKIE